MAVSGQPSPLSTPAAAGNDGFLIADLLWWMALASALVWLAVVGFLLYCLRARGSATSAASPRRIVGGDGVVLPTLLLAALIGNALPPIEGLVDGPPFADMTSVAAASTHPNRLGVWRCPPPVSP